MFLCIAVPLVICEWSLFFLYTCVPPGFCLIAKKNVGLSLLSVPLMRKMAEVVVYVAMPREVDG